MYNTRFKYFSRSYDKDKDQANGINSIIKRPCVTVDNHRQTKNLESRHGQSDCQSESDTGQLLQIFSY